MVGGVKEKKLCILLKSNVIKPTRVIPVYTGRKESRKPRTQPEYSVVKEVRSLFRL